MISYFRCLSLIAFTASAVMVSDDASSAVMVSDDASSDVMAWYNVGWIAGDIMWTAKQTYKGAKGVAGKTVEVAKAAVGKAIDAGAAVGEVVVAGGKKMYGYGDIRLEWNARKRGKEGVAYSMMAYNLKLCGTLELCESSGKLNDGDKYYMETEVAKLDVIHMTTTKNNTKGLWQTPLTHGTCFLARRKDDGVLVIAFTGTRPTDTTHWYHNLKIVKKEVEFPNKTLSVHSGFHEAWEDCWRVDGLENKLAEEIERIEGEGKELQIIVAGHSLGGAQAAVAAVQIALAYGGQIRLYTQGGPRVFTTEMDSADWIQDNLVQEEDPNDEDTWPEAGKIFAERWIVTGDPVASVPPSLASFRHYGQAILVHHNTIPFAKVHADKMQNIDYSSKKTPIGCLVSAGLSHPIHNYFSGISKVQDDSSLMQDYYEVENPGLWRSQSWKAAPDCSTAPGNDTDNDWSIEEYIF